MNNAIAGSPLAARQNNYFFIVILVALGIFAVLTAFYLLSLFIKKRHQSSKYVEAHKNYPTTQKNTAYVAKVCGLSKEERELLWHICHRSNFPNIEYSFRDNTKIDELFRKEYHQMVEQESSESEKSTLFYLRYKLERGYSAALIITSSKSIPDGQTFQYTAANGTQYELNMTHSTKEGLFFQLPALLAAGNDKPAELSKIALNFISKPGITYFIEGRIVRYQMAKDGGTEMLMAHTNVLKPMLRRQTKRIPINNICKFSAVKVSSSVIKGKTVVNYTPNEKRYQGILQDISAGGCRMLEQLPIREGQYIYIEFSFGGGQNNAVTGLIIKTANNNNSGQYTLHIQFVKLAEDLRNQILAQVYNYQ